MPSPNDLCLYNRTFYNREERDWYSGHCLGCVCLLGQIIFVGARSGSDVAALPLCGLGLWAWEKSSTLVSEEGRMYQRGLRGNMGLVGRGDHMRVCLRMVGKADDMWRRRQKILWANKLPNQYTAQHYKGGRELGLPYSLGRHPVSLYHELERGVFVVSVLFCLEFWVCQVASYRVAWWL